MRVIKIQRKITKDQTTRHSIRQFARDFFATENHLEFAIEALVFGVLLAISSWPILAAADVINRFL
ncbi:MAG TPA: hypothetical protein VIU85_06505 [Chthoniobacterales bacterium]